MRRNVSPNQRALNLWAVILIVWSIYRANFKLPEWFDECIAKPLVFVLPVYLYITRIEKKEFFSALYWKLTSRKSDIFLGIGIGVILFTTAIVGNYVKSGQFVFLSGKQPNVSLVLFIVFIALVTSISEEILSRGFILKRLYEESKNLYSSTFFSSLLFFFLHVPILFTNVKINGNMLLFFMATDMVLSITTALLFLDRKNLTIPILIHMFYNLSIYFFT